MAVLLLIITGVALFLLGYWIEHNQQRLTKLLVRQCRKLALSEHALVWQQARTIFRMQRVVTGPVAMTLGLLCLYAAVGAAQF